MKDGSIYKGNFDKGKFSGEGELVTKTFRYIGGWLDNKKHGQGLYIFQNGAKYEG